MKSDLLLTSEIEKFQALAGLDFNFAITSTSRNSHLDFPKIQFEIGFLESLAGNENRKAPA